MKNLVLLFIMLANIGYAQNTHSSKQTNHRNQIQSQKRLFDEDNIRETVFRYQFKHNGSGQKQNAKVYFLDIDYKDPSDEFIKRFKGHKPPVKKLSQVGSGDKEHGIVNDKETGELGLIFRIRKIKWISFNKVEVSGGYFEGSISASLNTYLVKRDRGKWIVKKNLIIGIS